MLVQNQSVRYAFFYFLTPQACSQQGQSVTKA